MPIEYLEVDVPFVANPDGTESTDFHPWFREGWGVARAVVERPETGPAVAHVTFFRGELPTSVDVLETIDSKGGWPSNGSSPWERGEF